MRHDSPATVKGSRHVCKTAGCKMNNYKARPAKARPYLGSSKPRGNVRGLKSQGEAMKDRPRSERQARRVALQQANKAARQ